MYTNFQWPIPSFYALPPESELAEHEPAVVYFLDGKKIVGQLSRFLPSSGMFEFFPGRRTVNIDVQLSNVEQLQLTRTLTLLTQAKPSEIEQRGPFTKPSEKQPFRIEFVNGNVLEGETAGYEVQEVGLFLYVLSDSVSFRRIFVPQSAIKARQIGPLIGEALVGEHLLTDSTIQKAITLQLDMRGLKLGEMLAEKKIISKDQLHAALAQLRDRPLLKLGQVLIDLNIINAGQLDNALDLQRKERKKPLGEILRELGYITKEQLRGILSQKLGIPSVDLTQFRIDPDALRALPEDLVRKHLMVPVCYDDGTLVLAMSNPLDPEPIERARFLTQGRVMTVMADADDIENAIATYYGGKSGEHQVEQIAEKLVAEAGADLTATDEDAIKENDNTLVRLVNKTIVDAHAAGVSDIHIESNPGRADVVIRFRKDGVLSEYIRLPYKFRNALTSRLKIMASLDISERRRSQDGRINFASFGPAKLELRIVTVPTHEGLEDIVMRLLVMGEPLPFARLGLREPLEIELKTLLARPHGLLLAVGPTGSGKTTSLHSLISVINVPGKKIWTAENPVEITQAGLRQVQVNPRIGWDFATVMRAFLRADPDVIMVGEMRDQETASIAVEAALTGHLVLSTLHTNSAPETVLRLLEMGLDPFSFSDSLLGVLGQRLVRRLCEKCRVQRTAIAKDIDELAAEYCHDTQLKPADIIAEWKKRYGATLSIHDSKGCEHCRKTGYHGRMGLHELLVVTPLVREQMLRHASAAELRATAILGGMRTLKQDGIEKCLSGLTDIHEVRAAAN